MFLQSSQKWRVAHSVAPLALLLLFACNDGTARLGAGGVPSGAGAPATDAGGDGGDSGPKASGINFTPASTLILHAKEVHELVVTVEPRGSFLVHFALLGGSDSAAGDAVLDASEAQTDSDGTARVMLTAPSAPTGFSVRASAGGKQTLLGVSVVKLGYTALEVLPAYNGPRAVSEWTTTVWAGMTCAELVGNPPPDGKLLVSAAPGGPLELEQVPIGVDLAVTVRAGHYIGGCANQTALSEGEGNQILVNASDRPVNLAATALTVTFGPSDSRPAFDRLLKDGQSVVESALVGEATSDVSALLDEMALATRAADQAAFAAARAKQDWDGALAAAFGKGAARRLRDPATRWMTAGLARLDAPDTFLGQLRADGDAARFELREVAGLTPDSAGFSSSLPASWSADSSDTLLTGTELTWTPSRLLTALADAPALLELPEAASIEAALSESIDCTLVGQSLVVHGDSPGTYLYARCDAACAARTCTSALTNLWQKARDASGSDLAKLSITASGAAEVGDAAEITALRGAWLGELSSGGQTALASGALSATSADP